MLLDLKLLRANMLSDDDRKLEALELLQAMMPEAKVCTANPVLYFRTIHEIAEALLYLHRNQEAHEIATELVAFAKATFGLEHQLTLAAVKTYALACATLGRVEEAKANAQEALTIETRVMGREHPDTQTTRRHMRALGFAEPSG